MQFEAQVTRRVLVPADPDRVAAYFAGNARLLERLVGNGRVQALGPGRYRVSLGTFEALGLAVRPVLDLRFEDHPGRTTMAAEEIRALEGPAGLALDARFAGSVAFRPAGDGCVLDCEASAALCATLPFPFNLLPETLLQATAAGVLGAALEAMAARFERLLHADLAVPASLAA